MSETLRWSLELPELLVGWVLAEGVTVRESGPKLQELLRARLEEPAAWGLDGETKAAVRDLLRGFGYKPSGRGKPASEYLAAAARKGRFPEILNVVDVNNLISLETGWPASILDLERARGEAPGLELRVGRPGESFEFNPAGQEIDVAGLPGVARVDGDAVANPVKDSMVAKVVPGGTRRVLGVLYTSRRVAGEEEVAAAARRCGELLERHADAESVESGVLGNSP